MTGKADLTMVRVLSAILFTGLLRADIAFDLRETISGHPSMVRKTTEITSHIFIKGGRVARLENQIVQIVDNENSQLTLIDYRDKKFATEDLSEAKRNRDFHFDQEFPQDIRIELISSEQPAEWEGRKTRRDVFRIKINTDPGPGEVILTVDKSAEPPRDFQSTIEASKSAESRYDQELDAEIQTLAFINMDRFKDIQKARQGEGPAGGLTLHSMAEFRLKKGSPLLETIGEQFADQVLMTKEMEVVDFSFGNVDFNVFMVPQGFEKVEMHQLLVQQNIRQNQ
jgi:hypothetical protein